MLYRIENLEKRREGDEGYRLLIRRLRIPRGARLAITGESGSGKSTTLDLLGLALAPDRADAFRFAPKGRETDIRKLWLERRLDHMAALRLAHMGYVLQTGGLLPFLSAAENMILTARMAGMAEDRALEAARALAADLGIADKLDQMPAALSVGQRQRVAIVRALVSEPELILADEPTAALDLKHAGKVMDAFLDAVADRDSALVMVTHNVGLALKKNLTVLRLREPNPDNPEETGFTAVLDDSEIVENRDDASC